ncbi:sensor histidine kinase [Frankia nepalensis]|nr:histidine kinase [Frankia nepalensis]
MGAVTTGGRVAVRRLEYRALLPAVLTRDISPAGAAEEPPAPRSARDWAVDIIFFALAVLAGLTLYAQTIEVNPDAPPGLRLADLASGLVACVALWWRRRWPATITIALTPLGAVSTSMGVAALILLFSTAVHRRLPVAAAVAGIFWLPNLVYPLVWPEPGFPYLASVALGTAMTVGVTGWGMFVRARRQLVFSWRERAALAEDTRHRQVADARRAERARIAREMHDVLGHRLTLLGLHAGALEYRPDAPPEQIAQAAGVVRASAQEALRDLRQVIGVLRTDDAGTDGEMPLVAAPTLADIPGLVDESRRAGIPVRAHYQLTEPHTATTSTAHAGYRTVQEGLTNARKHAPDATVKVLVDGAAASGLHIEIRNRLPAGRPGSAGPADGAHRRGTGLVGLTERVRLAGGALEHGVTADDEFRLYAWLPWDAQQAGAASGTSVAPAAYRRQFAGRLGAPAADAADVADAAREKGVASERRGTAEKDTAVQRGTAVDKGTAVQRGTAVERDTAVKVEKDTAGRDAG